MATRQHWSNGIHENGSKRICIVVFLKFLPILMSFFGLSRYGEALFMNSKLISGVTEFLNTEGELKEVNILR